MSDAERTHFWSLSGHDTFEGSDFPIGSFASEEEARGYALEWLREKDRLSSGGDGGQVRGGIQDRVYLIHHREGRSERIFPPMHPMPIYLCERSLLPDRVVLRHADARSALDFFGRSMWCVVTAVHGWLLYEERARFWRREPRLERAEEYGGTMHTYELRAGQRDTRGIVRESTARAHDELTRAYERWRRSPEAARTELCFEIVAQDDIPLKKVVEEVEELLGVELEPE